MKDITTRRNVFEKFRKEPGFFLRTAKQEGIPLSEVFRVEAPHADKGDHEDPLLDMIQKSGLRVESNRNYESSTLGDFTKTDYGHYLLFDYLDRCYEDTILGTRAPDPGSTGFDESNYLAGQVYRPYAERPLVQRKRIAPQIRIGDIVARVETVTEDLIRQPEYTLGDQPVGPVSADSSQIATQEQMIPISPGGKIPTTVISLGSRTTELKKVGIGLAVTDEFNSNNIRVSAVQTWVERVAVNHEKSIVEEGVNTLVTGPNAGVGNTAVPAPGARATNNLAGLIAMNTHFEEPYMVDLLVGRKSDVREWIAVVMQAGGATAQNFLAYPDGRFSGLFSPISLVNTSNAPTRIAYLPDTGNHGIAADRLLAIDSRVALVLYRHARGSVNERERIPSQQIEARYMTERYGYFIEDVNARTLFDIS